MSSSTDIAVQDPTADDKAALQQKAIAAIKARATESLSTGFDQLLAASAEDYDVLITKEVREKDTLVGVPFFVTHVTFNPGKNNSDFASLEITPQDGEPSVINDGGTGIRRQIVQMLASKGLVDPGDAVIGPNGEAFNPLDNPVSEWRKGQDIAHNPGFGPFHFLIPRGTRISTYTNEHGDSETWYLS